MPPISFGTGGSFLEFAALQRGRCAISYIHPSETATNSMAGATYFQSGAGGSFLEFAALQRGRCAISYIHPNVPTPGPPTSRAVQVNLREGPSVLRRCGRPVRTELGTRLHPVMSLLPMRGIDRGVQPIYELAWQASGGTIASDV